MIIFLYKPYICYTMKNTKIKVCVFGSMCIICLRLKSIVRAHQLNSLKTRKLSVNAYPTPKLMDLFSIISSNIFHFLTSKLHLYLSFNLITNNLLIKYFSRKNSWKIFFGGKFQNKFSPLPYQKVPKICHYLFFRENFLGQLPSSL